MKKNKKVMFVLLVNSLLLNCQDLGWKLVDRDEIHGRSLWRILTLENGAEAIELFKGNLVQQRLFDYTIDHEAGWVLFAQKRDAAWVSTLRKISLQNRVIEEKTINIEDVSEKWEIDTKSFSVFSRSVSR